MATIADRALDALACNAWQFTPNQLIFNREPIDEEWRMLLTYVKTTGSMFWAGDALAKLAEQYDAEFRAEVEGLERSQKQEEPGSIPALRPLMFAQSYSFSVLLCGG